MKRERRSLEQQLAVARSGSVIGEALGSERIFKRTFVSHVDGTMDWYAFQPPAFRSGEQSYTLIVYLHGMGSNYLEPFVSPPEQSIAEAISRADPSAGVLSCNYRKEASWGNELAIADVTQNIRQVLQEYPFARLVLVGTSMGGCTALNYAAVAPPDVQEKIRGVVSMEAAGDLLALFQTTSHRDIRPAMVIAFGGLPEHKDGSYRKASFFHNMGSLPAGLSFFVLGAKDDSIVPLGLQQELVRKLEEAHFSVRFEVIEGKHQTPAAHYFVDAVKFVLSGGQAP